MNRDIKFRLWDKQRETWIIDFHVMRSGYPAHNVYHKTEDGNGGEHEEVFDSQSVILMQYTGIKDKNGTEIYEGDLVRKVPEEWPSKSDEDERTLEEYLKDMSAVYEVSYQVDRFALFKEDSYRDSLNPGQHGSLEVIGNIYANPARQAS